MVHVVRMKREEEGERWEGRDVWCSVRMKREEEGERWEGRDVGCSVRMCLVSWCFVELV